ncbi:MAG TPA: diguanylate cyclase [Thermoanaerobaculia bacterium]|nr:diguanylate cyclase [Thermoanaerobaculia bacterium]
MSDSLLADLRDRFRDGARTRLVEMRVLLGCLERDDADPAALQQLAKHFHALAGMGGTYGFPRVSELGDRGEAEILPLVKRGGAASDTMIAHWWQLVDAIGREIEKSGEDLRGVTAKARTFDVLIVLADDDAALRVTEALEREDMRVRRCTPIEAIAHITDRTPDVAIVDTVEILEMFRERADVDVIVIGDAAFEERVRAIRSGAEAFVTTPIDMVALVRRVAALRERKERPAHRILAVEDDAVTIALMRGILSASGYEVEVCRDPRDFEKTLVAFQPDLLLMDVQLSHDVTGHDLVRYVRQSERFSTLPVIIVTSDSERRAMVEGTNAGADTLVTKPVDWDLLLAQIAARLERATVVRELTDRDSLTGVLTRGAFDARLRQREQDATAALVLIDLDHFKAINDTHGHAAGDRVLASMGTLLRRRLRHSDIVARYGGEEFALLLEDATVSDAEELCERLLAELGEIENGVTFSAGVAALHESFEESFRRADAALYEAKRAGRARIVSA